jgi:membrane protein DedA with SNARE-associated domain
MNFTRFTLFTFLGCLPWTFALAWAGLALGDNWETVLRYGEPISLAVGVVGVALIAWWLVRRRRRWRAATPPGSS